MRVFLRHCRHGLVKKFLGGPRFRPLPGSRLADRQHHSKYLPILLQRLEATPPCSATNSPAEEYQRICFFLFLFSSAGQTPRPHRPLASFRRLFFGVRSPHPTVAYVA